MSRSLIPRWCARWMCRSSSRNRATARSTVFPSAAGRSSPWWAAVSSTSCSPPRPAESMIVERFAADRRGKSGPGPCPVRLLGVAVLLTAVVLALGCPGRFDPAHEDVILIVVDTLRADHLGVYGYDRGTSPRLDGLARRAPVFDAAWSAAPWTLPSVTSMMTSRYPSSHRVENDGLKLGAGVPTLAETLGRAGYATGGYVSHVYVAAPFGLARGFETFEDFGVSKPEYRLQGRMEPKAEPGHHGGPGLVRRPGRRTRL